MIGKKLLVLLLGGILALGLMAGAVTTFAQTEEPTPTPTVPEEVAPDAATPSLRGSRLGDDDEALAEALGITVEELDAAQETARVALIDQAVADGHLTAEEGEALKADGDRLHNSSQYGYDKDEFLADALGVSVETLEAAQLEAYEAELAARVAAGDLTQEEADLKLAQKAAEGYLDTASINAQVRAAQEAAITAALADGAITQAQADALLAYLDANPYTFNGFNGHGGHGGHGGRGHGGGRGFDSLDATPATPDTGTTTTTGSGA